MKYIILALIIISAHVHSCVTATGEFSNEEELTEVDSIFIASLASWKEFEETPTVPNIIPAFINDPLVGVTFDIESTVFGEPLNSYFVSICFGDFKKGEKYIFLARKTRVYSYLENTQENLNMIKTYLKNRNY